jgi:hypothetical protein
LRATRKSSWCAGKAGASNPPIQTHNQNGEPLYAVALLRNMLRIATGIRSKTAAGDVVATIEKHLAEAPKLDHQ